MPRDYDTNTPDDAADFERHHSDEVADRPDPSEYLDDDPFLSAAEGEAAWRELLAELHADIPAVDPDDLPF
jgi:hypothetical protein